MVWPFSFFSLLQKSIRGFGRMSESAQGLAIVALGGNAITPPHTVGNIEEQYAQTRRTAVHLARVRAAGWPMIVTHGNGPQVGNTLRRVELASSEIYQLPLYVCVADTQAGMGLMIAQCLDNELIQLGLSPQSCTLVTSVLVDADDPAMSHPSKPIGRYYNAAEAETIRQKYAWPLKEVEGGSFRRVVPSPRPRQILELEAIRGLVAAGRVVVACGGGGVPIVRNAEGLLEGLEAVIDKDLTASLLAVEMNAETLLIVTGVEKVAIDYGKPTERRLARLSIAEACEHLAAGQFPAGSMGPKVQAAIDFLRLSRNPRAQVIITDIEHMAEALAGEAGTHFIK